MTEIGQLLPELDPQEEDLQDIVMIVIHQEVDCKQNK